MKNHTMTFEEFCEPFLKTADELEKRGINNEELKRRVQDARKEFAEKYLGNNEVIE